MLSADMKKTIMGTEDCEEEYPLIFTSMQDLDGDSNLCFADFKDGMIDVFGQLHDTYLEVPFFSSLPHLINKSPPCLCSVFDFTYWMRHVFKNSPLQTWFNFCDIIVQSKCMNLYILLDIFHVLIVACLLRLSTLVILSHLILLQDGSKFVSAIKIAMPEMTIKRLAKLALGFQS